MNVYQKIAAVMADLSKEGIGKDRKNQQQGYSFRGIDDVLNTLSRLLSKHGLVVLPEVTEHHQVERATMKGNPIFYSFVKVNFHYIDIDDPTSRHTVTTWGEAMDSADKSTNKAMSAAYKYSAILAFCIPTIGDEGDADSVTHEVAPKPVSAEQAKALRDLATQVKTPTPELLAKLEIPSWDHLPAARFEKVMHRMNDMVRNGE